MNYDLYLGIKCTIKYTNTYYNRFYIKKKHELRDEITTNSKRI